ncbi:S-layer homology domain-containing protein [Aceticella autotrophica]|uniref:S-layer homology domain-containing protein n=1 Tax=Aceticella autotrophica TaxID=2755338 RepID=A0A975GAR7_9THEO|nr:S-layer homology domain-containing protein [Aceticella autotrophica]QSZ27580.1 S-layer homology domain-containing protein [Aceticella autotrophica]
MKKKAISIIIAVVIQLLLIVHCILPVYAVVYTYDDLNRLTSATYDSSGNITYTYDAAGNITGIMTKGFITNEAKTTNSNNSGSTEFNTGNGTSGSSSTTTPTTYRITVNDAVYANVYTDKQAASAGDIVTINISNIQQGYRFKSITVTNGSGNQLATTEVKPGQQYTFTMPASAVTVSVIFEPIKPIIQKFKDINGHWAEETITKLADMGIVSGYEDGTFKPDNKITRAEATAILVRALKLSHGTEKDLKFADNVAIPIWAKGVVAAAAKEGLVKGYPQPDGSVTFEADRPISRVEIAAIIVRVMEKKIGKAIPSTLKFIDNTAIPEWGKTSVGIAVSKGIVVGYPDNTFRADNPVTRAEASVMVFRLLEILGNK